MPPAKHPIQGVLFDWDGTLLDSYHADSQAYLAMFRAMGVPFGLRELERHYSPNWYEVYRAAGLSQKHWDSADKLWRRHYATHKPQLIAGVRRVLASIGLRHRMGIVTSGDRDRVMRQLREFRLTRLFAARVCSGDTDEKKPHPAPLQLALEKMHLAPGACIYVGDTAQDLQMAQRAGVRSIAVLGPFPTEKQLRAARPEFLLSSIQELPALLRKLNRLSA
ncbi:MAG: HAD-IA family hydrolase [Candidatus Acidiferrum sp.]